MTGVADARGKSTRNAATFTLHEISYSPSIVFTAQQLKILSAPYMEKKISTRALNDLAKKITRIYQENGFLLSRAKVDFVSPAKHTARIQLIEMGININQSKIKSSVGNRIIKEYATYKIFSIPQSQRTLLLLNEIPGFEAKASVKPNKKRDAFNINVSSKQTTYDSKYRIDNYGSRNNNHTLRAITEVQAYNLLPGLETLGARGAEYMGDETVRYGELFTESWLGSHGLRLKNRVGVVDSEAPQSDLGFVAVGQSKFFETALFIPLMRTPQIDSSTQISWRHLASQSSIFDLDYSKDEVDVVQWSWNKSVTGNGKKTFTEISLGQGVDAIAGKSDKEFLSRPDADLNFTKFNLNHNRMYLVGAKGHQLNARFQSQISMDPLPASEEFVAGGAEFGRAFPFATITGDDGASFSIELTQPEYNLVPEIFSAKLYGFVDGAISHQKKTDIQDNNFDALSSTGVGVRGTVLHTTNFQFEISEPLYRNGILAREESSPRVSIILTGEF